MLGRQCDPHAGFRSSREGQTPPCKRRQSSQPESQMRALFRHIFAMELQKEKTSRAHYNIYIYIYIYK